MSKRNYLVKVKSKAIIEGISFELALGKLLRIT
jgi:hypothetical protein